MIRQMCTTGLAALFLAGVLVGCGGGDKPADKDAKDPKGKAADGDHKSQKDAGSGNANGGTPAPMPKDDPKPDDAEPMGDDKEPMGKVDVPMEDGKGPELPAKAETGSADKKGGVKVPE